MNERIKEGHQGATDSCLILDDKEYYVESRAWNLLCLIDSGKTDLLLDYIYNNFEEDVRLELND